jgi:hypothetical protein
LLYALLREATPFSFVDVRVLVRLSAISATEPPSTIPTLTTESNHTSDPRDVNSRRPEDVDAPMDLRFKVFAFFIAIATYNLT